MVPCRPLKQRQAELTAVPAPADDGDGKGSGSRDTGGDTSDRKISAAELGPQQILLFMIVRGAATQASEAAASRGRHAAGEGGGGGGRGGGDAGGDSSDDDVPEDFLDPILMTPMDDPVALPDSRAVVDRSTLARHLLSSATDPFTRAPLAASDARPLPELRSRIAAWRAARRGASGHDDQAL